MTASPTARWDEAAAGWYHLLLWRCGTAFVLSVCVSLPSRLKQCHFVISVARSTPIQTAAAAAAGW